LPLKPAVHVVVRSSIALLLALVAVLVESTAAAPATGPATVTLTAVQTVSAFVRHRRDAFVPGDVEII
jgi:hypothetical protein